MVSDVLETHWVTFPHDFIEIGWIELKFEQLLLESHFSSFWVPVVGCVTNFPQ